ncbi:Hypothetical predicted protein [Mytilus galloprovincialis]|uniref:uS12 prolyl 3-hydroxylase n=1 Tax=Mytilus galloprovincialis TaxID=29158 RepID=A0A8B6FPA5_MYTGA|nr:Hypothetical predicted protein [Mytilus galloprovincialis]
MPKKRFAPNSNRRNDEKRSKEHNNSNVEPPVLIDDMKSCNIAKLFKESYSDKTETCKGCINFSHQPFFHAVINNFVQNVEFLQQLQEELSELTFTEKNNDLYKFYQSKEDLKVVDLPYINALRSLIYKDLKEWITDITGIELVDTVDLSCAKYQYTDTLLCHDDELDDRRIAFIYYLVPEKWTKEDGGALDLFNVNENGQPDATVKSILPVRNNFAFFEVNAVSYHQVAEVLTEDKTRLSISGWFHGPPVERPEPYVESPVTLHPSRSVDENTFYDWINPAYLDPVTQSEIQEKFEDDSEIELTDFLLPEKYEELKTAIQETNLEWKRKGPANKRKYSALDLNSAPEILKTCLDFLQSDALFLVLSNITGLKLHELASCSDSDGETSENNQNNGEEKIPCCHSEVRKWNHGNYTLIRDTDCTTADFELDSLLHICCEGWSEEYGGFTSYIAKGEDEELLSVYPTENSLSLVYRDKGTLKFVKYLNHKVTQMPTKGFYDILSVYRE